MDHGLNPWSAEGDDGADGDPDADGFTNWEEQLAETDPQQPASALRAQVRGLEAGRALFSWGAVPGRTYALQWTTNLARPFVNLAVPGFPQVAESVFESVELDLGMFIPQSTTLFLRIQVLPR